MNKLLLVKILFLALEVKLGFSQTSNHSGRKGPRHGNIFSAIADIADRAKSTFSEALLPSPPASRSSAPAPPRPSLLEAFYEKFSRAPAPTEAAQLQRLSQFSQPELVSFTKADTFKRSSGSDGYSYLTPDPDNQLNLPSEKLQRRQKSESRSSEALETDESRGTSFLRASPISVTTPVSNIRIIQDIRLQPSPAPSVSKFPAKQKLPRRPKQQQSPALRFPENPLVAVLGRQVKGDPIEGFPDGLPEFTPKGVRITLENMIGPDGEMVMNPIPGEAGTDYPVYTSVPDTGFNCGQQDFPGIYTDLQADCQVFYMCEPNGRQTGFLCPNGTIFNQQYFVCDWWYNLDCAQQQEFYSLNQFLYEENENEGDYDYDLK